MNKQYPENYHFDWNELMQVVQQIELIHTFGFSNIEIHIMKSFCKTLVDNGDEYEEANIGRTKMYAVYLNTLNFLRWYYDFVMKKGKL